MKFLGWLVLLVFLSACTSTLEQTSVPTQTLIPATATPTATPILPTNTPQDLPAPQDLLHTPTSIPLAPILQSNVTYPTELVESLRADIARELSVSLDSVQFGQIIARVYTASNHDCPTSRTPLPEVGDRGYRITLLNGSRTYSYFTWNEDEFVWCDEGDISDALLVGVDPVAAELTALARRRVQQAENAALDDLSLVSASAVRWKDSSLGCPQADQNYAETEIDGYRLVISDGENEYIFHSDSVRIIPCDAEDETD